MDPARFFAASRLAIVAGKGGVGKTTVSAALARAAARVGRPSLVVEVEGKSGLATAFERPELSYEPSEMWPRGDPPGAAAVDARALTADDALLEYLADHGLDRVSRRLVRSGALDVVATAAPGIEDILLLGKVKQIERAESERLVVLDTPAAGHAVTFLRSARGLLDAVSAGPIRAQASDVLEMLTDPARTRVLLVTIPEETPINELIETAYRLEDEVGIALGPIIVNGVAPEPPSLPTDARAAAAAAGVELTEEEADALDAAASFRHERAELQRAQLAHLGRALPLPQIHLPAASAVELGRGEIDRLARALVDGVAALADTEVTAGERGQ
ncbi:ArsA family ATPase [Actinomarinicola tropica]|uniref:ATPase n=1 Tax=Actinomarinicola tropica TaxID=2789776 RepID=A0A5Q2RPP6_9ACTN|nr:ArsA-related P-loop ATPase [Actinomarinicola tropica]QGG96551.1 ATPase [Actinomarinicola tropica]